MASFFRSRRRSSATQLIVAAAICLLLAGALLPIALSPDADVPALAEAQGNLAWVGGHRYGVRFRLTGRQETFDYRSKSGKLSVVRDTLIDAKGKPIGILFNPIPHKSGLSDEIRNDVWQLSVDYKPVRTLSDVKDAWRSDNEIVRWILPFLLVYGLYCAWQAWRTRMAASVQ